MASRDAACTAVLHDFQFGQDADEGRRQHFLGPIAHCSISEKLGAGVRRHSWSAGRWLALAAESQVTFDNAFCA